MVSRLPVFDDDGEVDDLSRVPPGAFKSFSDLSPTLQTKLRALRGPQKAPTKIPTSIRLDADVVAAFKAMGNGWQTRMNAALKDWLKTHGLESNNRLAALGETASDTPPIPRRRQRA